MNCNEIRGQLEAFLQGRLSGPDSLGVRNHLAACRSCASALRPEDMLEILPAMDPEIEPSPDFHERFLLRLESHRAQRSSSLKLPRSSWTDIGSWSWIHRLAGAGVLAGILGVGIYFGLRQAQEPVAGPAILGEITMAENLPLLKDMGVIENLELLEDFDAIQNMTDGQTPSAVH